MRKFLDVFIWRVCVTPFVAALTIADLVYPCSPGHSQTTTEYALFMCGVGQNGQGCYMLMNPSDLVVGDGHGGLSTA